MKTLFIGLKDIILILRDRKTLFTLLGTPLILTFVLGTALSPLWGGNEQNLGLLLVINSDAQGQFSKILVEEVYGSEEFSQRFEVEIIDDFKEGEKLVNSGNAIALVSIPEDFSADLIMGRHTKLEIIGDAGNTFLPPVIMNVTEMFVEEVTIKLVAINLSTQFISGDINEKIEEVVGLLDTREPYINLIKDTSYSNRIEDPASNTNPMGYYSAAMAVMYLLFNANLGGKRILQEREQGTLQRLRVSNINPFEFIMGKTLGIYFSSFIQLIVLINFTRIFYNVDWGGQGKVLAFSAVVVLATSGIGMFIASLSDTASGADGLGSLIILCMSALGGSMFPLMGMPPLMQMLSKLTFNRWAIDGFYQIMFFNTSLTSLYQNLLILASIGLVTMSFSIFRLAKLEVK
ncbi:ABC transporter permease [Alkalicella caledoniensis]|uniref:ABC transporter permease n=1 Tax=Alkalicella caledoniensis TaxID=2731377 RepID=A0A7G9W762_ALKCA|nr:ABC transporter permease [Alkalicella caledoniensis]QNO14524.1 ABC transporter permease [Alkalicella caledoniensis]